MMGLADYKQTTDEYGGNIDETPGLLLREPDQIADYWALVDDTPRQERDEVVDDITLFMDQ